MMQIHLVTHPAPAEWGEKNLVSHSTHGLQIHLPDGSALMTLQQAARRIAGLGIKAVQLMGHWSMPQQWAFAQGYMPTAGAETVTLRWADAPEVELLELEQRLYCATWVRRLTNLSPQELGPLDVALESVTFLSELAPTQISHRILKGDALLEAGWVGLHAVGRASRREPVLLELDFNPTRDRRAPVAACLVGKGGSPSTLADTVSRVQKVC